MKIWYSLSSHLIVCICDRALIQDCGPGGAQRSFDPRGEPCAQNLLKIVFPLKLFENCKILKKSWGQGGPVPRAPGSAGDLWPGVDPGFWSRGPRPEQICRKFNESRGEWFSYFLKARKTPLWSKFERKSSVIHAMANNYACPSVKVCSKCGKQFFRQKCRVQLALPGPRHSKSRVHVCGENRNPVVSRKCDVIHRLAFSCARILGSCFARECRTISFVLYK